MKGVQKLARAANGMRDTPLSESHSNEMVTRKRSNRTRSGNNEKRSDKNDASSYSSSSTEDEFSDSEGTWLNDEQEKAITKVLVANAKRKSPAAIAKLGSKLAKVDRLIEQPEQVQQDQSAQKIVLKDLELARLNKMEFNDSDNENNSEPRQDGTPQLSSNAPDVKSALQALRELDNDTDCEPYSIMTQLDSMDPTTDDQQGQPTQYSHEVNTPVMGKSPSSSVSSSWSKYFKEVENRRGLSDEDKFLKTFFTQEMWKGNSGLLEGEPNIAIREVDLSINDALDEAELIKSDHFEAEHNFRYERGSSRTQVIGHARLSDAFKPIKELSKRARQRLNKKERKLAELAEKKERLLTGSSGTAAVKLDDSLDVTAAEDEDYPSDQEWFLCDACNTAIGGGKVRYDCAQEDCDYCLCKSCQKKVKHEHALRRVKTSVDCAPPKSWPLMAAARNNVDMADQLTQNILKSLKYDVANDDGGFPYIECAPLDFGLSEEDLLTIDDAKLNALAPPTCLEPYEDPSKVSYLYEKGLRKVQDFKNRSIRQYQHGKSTAEKLEPSEADIETKKESVSP